MCNKVPTPPTSLCLPPSFICGWGMQGERGEESGRVSPPVTLSHNTVRATGLMLSSSTPTHTSTESETRWERERVRERGTARRERRGEREGHSKGDKKKNPEERKQKDFLFFSRGAAANNPRWRMAEGGEGEEEIQFLRTVSPAYSPFSGKANLHRLPEGSLGLEKKMRSYQKWNERERKPDAINLYPVWFNSWPKINSWSSSINFIPPLISQFLHF